METNKISGGYARVSQILILLFFTPFLVTLIYVIFSNKVTIQSLIFLFALSFVMILFVWNAFSYSDVYLTNDLIISKKLFSTKRKRRNEIKNITEAFRPFTYKIEFIDGKKISFLSTLFDNFKHILSSDPNATLTSVSNKIKGFGNDN